MAKEYGILKTILKGHLYGTILNRLRGRGGVLTHKEEEELVEYLVSMPNMGFPLTIRQLQEKVGILAQARVIPFKDGIPGVGWVKCFKGRHSQLAMRKLQTLEQK